MFELLKKLFKKKGSSLSDHNQDSSDMDALGNFNYNDSLNLEDYQYKFTGELATLWTGHLAPFEFTIYDDNLKRQRIIGALTALYINDDGEFLLQVTDETNTITIYKEEKARTKFVVGSTRYKFTELCSKRLKTDNDIFSFARAIREKASTFVDTGKPNKIDVSFTYIKYKNTGEKDRHKINTMAIGIQKNKYGSYCIVCQDPNTGSTEYYKQSKIDTKYTTKEHGKLSFDEFKKIFFDAD